MFTLWYRPYCLRPKGKRRLDFLQEPRIFRENTKRKAITDSYNLNRFAEVACEFNVRR
jgi:hypothetical protein